ncbi:unnamed protein product, partial [Heterosigma akashiwo]
RCYSIPSVEVFDSKVKKIQRNTANLDPVKSRGYDYLRVEVARRLVDRLEDVMKEFPLALDLGCHSGQIYQQLVKEKALSGEGGVGGIKDLVMADCSEKALLRDAEEILEGDSTLVQTHPILVDSEFLPFNDKCFDLVISNLHLHWVNDLPNCLQEINRVLKPDGVFLGSMMGGNTLQELRTCLLMAEQEREGGMSVHTSPTAHLADCGNLLQAARFSLPTIDTDTFVIEYDDAFELMEHLQGMGEGNATINRRQHVPRDTFLAAASLYQELYGTNEGRIPATFQVVYMIGWAPHESQPQPKRRGSAQKSMKVDLHHHKGGGKSL